MVVQGETDIFWGGTWYKNVENHWVKSTTYQSFSWIVQITAFYLKHLNNCWKWRRSGNILTLASDMASFLRGGRGGGLSSSSPSWWRLPQDTDWNSVEKQDRPSEKLGNTISYEHILPTITNKGLTQRRTISDTALPAVLCLQWLEVSFLAIGISSTTPRSLNAD